MRRVPAALDLHQLDRPAHLGADRLELGHRAVLVVVPLNSEHRAIDPRKVFLDVPLTEVRMHNVNNWHKRFRDWHNVDLRSVATKYLLNYTTWFIFLDQARKMS